MRGWWERASRRGDIGGICGTEPGGGEARLIENWDKSKGEDVLLSVCLSPGRSSSRPTSTLTFCLKQPCSRLEQMLSTSSSGLQHGHGPALLSFRPRVSSTPLPQPPTPELDS